MGHGFEDVFVRGRKKPDSVTTARKEAEKTYGKNFDKVLSKKHFLFFLNKHKIPTEIADYETPSYHPEDWKKELPVYESKAATNVKGVYSEGRIGIDITGHKSELQATKEHETVHSLVHNKIDRHMEEREADVKFRNRVPRGMPAGARPFVKPPEVQDDNFKKWISELEEGHFKEGAAATTKKGELVPLLTPIIRGYRRDTGTRIDTPEAVFDALKHAKEKLDPTVLSPAELEFERGKIEGLEKRSYIGDLGQLIVKNKPRKKGLFEA